MVRFNADKKVPIDFINYIMQLYLLLFKDLFPHPLPPPVPFVKQKTINELHLTMVTLPSE